MLLTIDVGNTETKLGCFSGERLTHTWRVTTELRRTPDEYGVFFTQLFATGNVELAAIRTVVIASVVPKLDPILESVCTRFFGTTPVFLTPQTQRLIPVVTENPAEVGADLVAAAIGGLERFGAPLILVSFGTATVFIAISAAREYLGVAIAPGINVSIDALDWADGQTSADRARSARPGDRTQYRRGVAERHRLRLCRTGRGDRRADSDWRWAFARRSWPRAGWGTSWPSRRPSSKPWIRT